MIRSYRIAIAATAVALSAAGAVAAPAAPEYVKMAGASDLYEKTSSQVVLESTQDEKVRSFANMMVADHTDSTNKVVTAAQADGMTPPPPMLMPKQEKMVADLRKADGKKRDMLYWKQQKMAHKEALALHKGYAGSGDSAALKGAAAQIAPVVQHHIDMLNGKSGM